MEEVQPQPSSIWKRGSGTSHETWLRKDVIKVVGHITGDRGGIRKALNGVLKDRILNREKYWLTVHFQSVCWAPTLDSGDRNMNKIFSCSQGVEKTGKVNYSKAKASWRKWGWVLKGVWGLTRKRRKEVEKGKCTIQRRHNRCETLKRDRIRHLWKCKTPGWPEHRMLEHGEQEMGLMWHGGQIKRVLVLDICPCKGFRLFL